MIVEIIFLSVFGLISLLCAIHLWRRRDATLLMKIRWTIVIFIPLAGPIFYGGFFKAPDRSGYRKHWPEDRGGLPPGGEFTGRWR